MRRASTCLAVLGLSASRWRCPASRRRRRTVTFKAKAVPIPGFPHTGNILGAGAAVQAEYTIEGTEYGGFPPPLKASTSTCPQGAVLHPSGFPTCPPSTLEPTGKGPKGCPRARRQVLSAKSLGYVAFGTKIVPEEATVESFYARGGGLEFFTFGHEPTIMEIISKAPLRQRGRPVQPRADRRNPARRNGAGRARTPPSRASRSRSARPTRRARQDDLLRPTADEVPERRLPAEDRTDLRRARRPAKQTVTKTYKAPCPSQK